jgi:hypothetical protein
MHEVAVDEDQARAVCTPVDDMGVPDLFIKGTGS